MKTTTTKKTTTTTQENKFNKDEGATPQKMEAKPSGCACVYSVRLERMMRGAHRINKHVVEKRVYTKYTSYNIDAQCDIMACVFH